MKKVLALVLAVMMMATVAFAATPDVTNPESGDNSKYTGVKIPGSKININDSGIANAPGSTLTVGSGVSNVHPVNSSNYTMKVKWDDGGKLVESVKFDDANDKLVIKLKQDYTMTSPKDLKGTITLTGKKKVDVGGTKQKIHTITIGISYKVGYVLADGKVNVPGIAITNDNVADISNTNATTPVSSFHDKAKDADIYLWKVTGSTAKYGTLSFPTADPDTEVEVRVYDGDKLYLFNNTDADTDILKKYADADAEISFLNFPGNPTFNSTAKVSFYKDEESYIYENKDGNLVPVTAASAGAAGQSVGNVKWDDEAGCYILNTRTLGKYVFSDKKLNVAATTTTNPDTGANDVVGVATALAAVALVSAAAVSLKK